MFYENRLIQKKISATLRFKHSSSVSLQPKVSMFLISQKKDRFYVNVSDCSHCIDTTFVSFQLPEEKALKEYIIPDNTLILHFELSYLNVKSNVKHNITVKQTKENIELFKKEQEYSYNKKLTLINHGSLYEKQQLCDVTFVTEKGELKAHRVILAMASPYFLAMFSHKDLKESVQHVVDLTNDPDITFDIYRGFLDYIYGLKSVYELSSIAKDLLILADKYDMQELKKTCEKYLCDTLDNKNVSKLLYFAHKYNCESLLQQALDYARDDIDVIKKSDEFDLIFQSKDLMLKLL